MLETPEKPIFIVGMPRSGTSLLLALLSAHPNIAITPETQFFGIWMRMYRHLDSEKPKDMELFWKAFSTGRHYLRLGLDTERVHAQASEAGMMTHRSIFTAVMREYAHAKGKNRIGEKSPRHFAYLSTLFDWYPDAKVLFLLRDPRACVASARKAPWGNPSVYSQSLTWNESMDCYEEYKDDPRVMLVRYEELVQTPEPHVRGICDFLGEEYTEKLLDHATHSSFSDYHPSHGMWGVRHRDQYMQPISAKHTDKWKQKLSKNQIAVVDHLTGKRMRRFGYTPISDEKSVQHLYLLASKLWSYLGIAKPISQLWILHHAWYVPCSWLLSRMRRFR